MQQLILVSYFDLQNLHPYISHLSLIIRKFLKYQQQLMAGEIKLEVVTDSIASALAAEEGGASRLELCSALLEGGLTPSCGVLKTLKSLPVRIPIFCMLRLRRGNDFLYTSNEMTAMLDDMELLRSHGADGFVFGALTPERTINVEQCRQIVRAAGNLPVTFHRAFDLTDPLKMHETTKQIIDLGFKRILSSGFNAAAIDGSEFLASLIARHHKDIIVMPGAGISVGNLDDILTATRCIEFHASALPAAGDPGPMHRMECDVPMGKHDLEPYAVTDVQVVRKMVKIARAMAAK